MIAADILLDGLFAAIAAIGFGAVSDPPMRAFPRIALLAAVGHLSLGEWKSIPFHSTMPKSRSFYFVALMQPMLSTT